MFKLAVEEKNGNQSVLPVVPELESKNNFPMAPSLISLPVGVSAESS